MPVVTTVMTMVTTVMVMVTVTMKMLLLGTRLRQDDHNGQMSEIVRSLENVHAFHR